MALEGERQAKKAKSIKLRIRIGHRLHNNSKKKVSNGVKPT